MREWFPPFLAGCGCFVWFSLQPLGYGQEKATPSAGSLTVFQAMTQVGKDEEDLAGKVEALRKLIDTEVAAQRLNETMAKSLRWMLKSATLTPGADFSTVNNSRSLSFDNKAVAEGMQALEADWNGAQLRRHNLIKSATADAREQVSAIVKAAKKPADLDPLIATVDRLIEVALVRNSSGALSTINSANVQSYPAFLRALRQLLEVQGQADADVTGVAVSQFHNAIYSVRSVIKEPEANERIQQALAPYLKAIDDHQAAFDRLLQDKRPSTEYTAAIASLEKAIADYHRARGGADVKPVRETINIIATCRGFQAAAAAIEKEDFIEARTILSRVRDSSFQSMSPASAAVFASRMGEWNKVIEEGLQAARNKRSETFRIRLSAVKTPADLEALGMEMLKPEGSSRDNRESDLPRELATQLGVLVGIWSAGNLGQWTQQGYPNSNDPRFASELTALRQRIERDLLGRNLGIPEINQPPLVELPLDAAVDKVIEKLAAEGKWRQVLQVVEGRSRSARFEGGSPQASDLAMAIRSFIAAQNLELAEQWTDAVQSYKAVLRATSERAPVKEAAERIKVLGKQHPEAMVEPTSPPLRRVVPFVEP